MLWRNTPSAQFRGLDAHEPKGVDRGITNFGCQHFGKAISVEQWEATCDCHFAEHFPLETYRRKWLNRKGKGIHTQSDFSMPLYEWEYDLFANAIPTNEVPQTSDRPEAPQTADQPSLLLATNHLFGWTGSETLLLTLAEGLRKHGCKLAIYARHLDKAWASSQINPDIHLVDSLDALRTIEFDIAHVQHSSCLVDIRAAFPTLPILFSSLGVLPFLEHPPLFDCGIAHYLAISEEVEAHLMSRGISESKIDIVRNLVSSQRFSPTQPIRKTPERILVISNKMDEARKLMLLVTARTLGASIRFVGGDPDTLPQDQLVTAINTADVVVSLGRGVVEAMLCGRVPLVFDVHGGDGLVTPDNIESLRTCNFSGRYHRHEYTIDDLVAELRKYRQDFGNRLRLIAEEQFGLEANLPRLLTIYSTVAATKVMLTAEHKELIAFCSLLAREDIQQSKHHRGINENLQGEVARIKRTISWRITSPLRVGWNLLRRLARQLHKRWG